MLPNLWQSHLLGSSNGSLCRCCNTTSAPQQQLSLTFLICMFIWIYLFYSGPRDTIGWFAWHTSLVFVSGQLKIDLLHFCIYIIFEESPMSWSFPMEFFYWDFPASVPFWQPISLTICKRVGLWGVFKYEYYSLVPRMDTWWAVPT